MSHSPSCTMESITWPFPRRYPLRACGSRYGALVIDSMPPATTMELFPVCTACAARATAFNPEPQTLLIVMAPVAGDKPPKIAACRAGFCPSPLHCLAHHDRTQLRRTQIGETALKLSHCRTTTRNDDNIIESRHGSCSREDFATVIIDAPSSKMIENDELL